MLLLGAGLTGLFLTGDVFNFYVFFELAMTAAYVLTSVRRTSAAQLRRGARLRRRQPARLVRVPDRGRGALPRHRHARDGRRGERAWPTSSPARRILIARRFFVAFGVKLGLFPFHFWLPAVYTGASPAVAAILSGALANIGAYGLLRFGAEHAARASSASAAGPDRASGARRIIYGALLAISRPRRREVLAYSAIGQVGYVLSRIGVGGPVGSAAAMLYAVVNALNKTLLFLAVGLRGALVAGRVRGRRASAWRGAAGGRLRRQARVVPQRRRRRQRRDRRAPLSPAARSRSSTCSSSTSTSSGSTRR